MNALEVRELDHWYGEGEARRQVLFENTLEIPPGELVIMTGPSGSGKSTLLTLIGGLRAVQKGSLRVLGDELRGLPEPALVAHRRRIGFIFQAHNLLPTLTATQNVLLTLDLHPGSKLEKRKRAEEALATLGLGGRLDHKPGQLSGGQRQRVAIARALVHRPRLVLADEPTAALDKASSRDVVDLFRRMVREEGSTILMVTHDSRILDVADRIVSMVDGRVVGDAGVEESMEICESLKRIALLKDQPPAMLADLARRMRREKHAAGAEVIRQGEVGDAFYMLHTGTVSVSVGSGSAERVLNTLRAGDCFGEVALLRNEPRNATVRALEPIEVFALPKHDFDLALAESKSLEHQLRELMFHRTA